jgi:3-hydroxyacyl-[acyl-carrier-protein] dehydratase
MPAPLADLANLDLSRTVYSVADMHEVLRQRGTFSLVDGILHLDPRHADPSKREIVVGYKDVRADEWWARDHIPGRPIFPGVLMVEASAQLGSFDFFVRHPELPKAFVAFTGIDSTRFRATVEPPCRLYFVGRVSRSRVGGGKVVFSYEFQGLVDGKIVYEAEVTGMQL